MTGAPALVWARQHLFRSRRDGVITVVTVSVGLLLAFRAVRFVFVSGRWEIVRTNLGLYMYGSYPTDELWRIVAALWSTAAVGGVVAGALHRRRVAARVESGEIVPAPSVPDRVLDMARRLWPAVALVVVLCALARTVTPTLVALVGVAVAAAGRLIGAVLPRRLAAAAYVLPVILPVVLLPLLTAPRGWDDWGGLMITLLLASVSMLACFPLGLLLALGRRSSLPAVRVLCIAVIEFFRGIPLVVLVMMSSVALGFFFPQSILPGRVVRVVVAFTVFTAAYVAEIVRGGLQSVPRGQIEAAQALGLSPVRVTVQIVLPQALRNVIPALVGQFISLFKDTTLVFIIGFSDLLSIADAVTKQRAFDASNFPEAALFAAALFWVGSFTLSRESRRLEHHLGVGTR